MNNFEAKLIKTEEIARQTQSFHFEMQGGGFEFQPGQFVTLSMPAALGLEEKESSRIFSIASSPDEPHLMFATRMTGSDFKKALAAMKPGDLAHIEGPSGDLVLDADESDPAIFLAGGIGITPFRSMIRHAVDRNLSRPLLLLYSNRTPEDAAFLDELEAWANDQSNFRLLATMTKPEKSATTWQGPTGHVDAEFLSEKVEKSGKSEFYAAGPPRFVKEMTKLLNETGVPKSRIHAESFSGY